MNPAVQPNSLEDKDDQVPFCSSVPRAPRWQMTPPPPQIETQPAVGKIGKIGKIGFRV